MISIILKYIFCNYKLLKGYNQSYRCNSIYFPFSLNSTIYVFTYYNCRFLNLSNCLYIYKDNNYVTLLHRNYVFYNLK